MGRGVHFHHKQKGHDHEKPQHGEPAPSKHTERVAYDIHTVATAESGPVSITTKKDG